MVSMELILLISVSWYDMEFNNNKDPIPMLYNGNMRRPKAGFMKSDDTMIDLAKIATKIKWHKR